VAAVSVRFAQVAAARSGGLRFVWETTVLRNRVLRRRVEEEGRRREREVWEGRRFEGKEQMMER